MGGGSQCGVGEVSCLLGYDAVSLGEQSRTFQRIMLPLPSTICSPRIMKINATWSRETSGTTHMTWCHIPEHLNPHKLFSS